MEPQLITKNLIFSTCLFSFRVLESMVKLGDERPQVAFSGARLDPEGRTARVSDLTICSRVKLKILGGYEGPAYLWNIADYMSNEEVGGDSGL